MEPQCRLPQDEISAGYMQRTAVDPARVYLDDRCLSDNRVPPASEWTRFLDYVPFRHGASPTQVGVISICSPGVSSTSGGLCDQVSWVRA